MLTRRRQFEVAGSAVVLAAIAAFVALYIVAARRYPGGTWADPTTHGHRFWQNFLCDLEWRTALDGRLNPGAGAMRGAMLAIDLGLLAVWFLNASGFSARALAARGVRGLGVLSAVALAVVALVPSEISAGVHELAVICAAVPALVAAGVSISVFWRDDPPPRIVAWLGTGTLGLAAVDLVLYVRHTLVPGTSTFAIPAIQKVALILALVWMSAIAVRALLRASAGGAR